MKAKDYLNQIKKINSLINNKLAEVSFWKGVASGSTATMEGERVQSSGSKDKMADAVCRYLQMEQEIDEAIDQLVQAKQDIIRVIEQLPAVEYDVLHKIYVQEKEFYEIADSMKKSYSWVTTIHGRGLSKVQKIIDNSEVG